MKKILIADDESALLNALLKKVSSEGYAVIPAIDGDEALKKANEEKPDLILLDIMMPGKHGLDVFNEIRKSEWGKKVPIFFLTNFSEHPEATKLASKDPNCEYLVKASIKISDVIALIKTKLK